jgi:hypothetical protein
MLKMETNAFDVIFTINNVSSFFLNTIIFIRFKCKFERTRMMRKKKVPSHSMILFTIIYTLWASSVSAQVNQLTGQVSQQIPLPGGVSLQYDGAVSKKVQTPNEKEPANWVGLGWKTGLPSIVAFYNNTVDLHDDKWYFDDGFGNMSEIIGIAVSTSEEKFTIKLDPLQKVTVIDNNPSSGQPRIIKGWVVTSIDGTISRYGYVEGKTEDAMPYLPYWGNVIAPGRPGSPAPGKCYYRWYLKETEDINHNKTQYSYTALTAQTPAGFTYTKETYPHQIINPLGQIVTFELDPNNKSVNEGPLEPPLGGFNFTETRFLRKVFLTNPNSTDTAERAYLKYSGDPAEVVHIRNTERGFAKRLLTGIDFKYNKAKNLQFRYSATDGLLSRATSVQKGSSTEYSYANKRFDLDKKRETATNETEWDKTESILIGNQIFYVHRQNTTSAIIDSFSIYSKVQNDWVKSTIPEITGTYFSFGAKIFLYADRFVIHYKTADNKSEVRLFQWIDNKWHLFWQDSRNPGSAIDLEKTVFVHGQTYVLEHDRDFGLNSYLKVIEQSPNDEMWNVVANFQTSQQTLGRVAVAKNYFLYSFPGKLSGPADYRKVRVFRNDGNGWYEHNLPNNAMFLEGASGCEMFAFDNYFIIKKNEDRDIAIRRWNPVNSQFEVEYLENTNLNRDAALGSFTWPRPIEFYCGNDYMVFIEPHNDDFMMIYRYLRQNSGTYQWHRTYIKATGDCSAPAIANAAHSFASRQNPTPQQHEYAKNFQNANGNINVLPPWRNGVQCSDRHFFVTGDQGGKNYIWDFRWTGDEQGPLDGWESKINGDPAGNSSGDDINCQGFELNNDRTIENAYVNPDNVGLWLLKNNGDHVHQCYTIIILPAGIVSEFYQMILYRQKCSKVMKLHCIFTRKFIRHWIFISMNDI